MRECRGQAQKVIIRKEKVQLMRTTMSTVNAIG